MRLGIVSLGLMMTVVASPVRAAEEPAGHAAHPTHTVVLTRDSVRPARTTMARSDVLGFENVTFYPVKVTFTEPADLKERIRCGLVRDKATDELKAPWLLFSWTDGKLSAILPPGRFSNLCSLAPGRYTFLAAIEGTVEGAPGNPLPAKGEVVVE